VNRVSVRNANNPMPTGHGEAGTELLSSFEDGHYSGAHSLISSEVETHAPYGLREIARNAREFVENNTHVHRH
jgi:hypothetical protein